MIPELLVVAFVIGALCGVFGLAAALHRLGFFRDAEAATQWRFLEVCLQARGLQYVTPKLILDLLPERI
jgi:hypothetical protein